MAYGWVYNDSPFPGYDLVVEDFDGDYEWSLTAVFYRDGLFYTFRDVGCSCNGPYEGAVEDDLVPTPNFQAALEGLSGEAIEKALRWEREY